MALSEEAKPTMTAEEVEAACRTLHLGETPEQCERRHRRAREGHPLPAAAIRDLCERHAVERVPAAEGE